MGSHLAIIILALTLIGCGDSSSSSPQPTGLNLINFKLEFEDVMEFEQGELKDYPVTYEVPSGYTPTVSAENLPEGATFENQTLSWKPSCQIDFQSGAFFRGYMYYHVIFSLRLQESKDSVIQKSALMIVNKFNKPGKKCGE